MSGYVLNQCSECKAGPSAPQHHRSNVIGGAHRFTSPLMNRAAVHALEVGIDFDEAGHVYTLPIVDVLGQQEGRGAVVPSVTQILKDNGLVDYAWCSDFHRDRGSLAHEAIHFMCEGDLDSSSLDANLTPYVASAEAFLSDMEAEIVAVEAVVYSALYGYAGKPDLMLFPRRRKRLMCADWKLGDPPLATGLQLSGYAGAWLEMHGEAVIDRVAVHLTPGRPKPYRLIEYTDRSDLAVFRGAAAVTNYKRRHLVRAA